MEHNKTVTRRFFNGFIASLGALFGFKPKRTKADWEIAQEECDQAIAEMEKEEFMEVLIIPEHFRHPYPPKTLEVLYNHKMAGKSKAELKEFILSQAKVIKIPLK